MTTCENKYLESLKSQLPEEIIKYRMAGLISEANVACDRWLLKATTQEMRDRITIEKEFLSMLEAQYPYNTESALALAQKDIPEFGLDDLLKYDHEGVIEWIYINGEKRYISSFWRTLTHVIKELHDVVHCDDTEEQNGDKFLFETIHDMMETGSAAYETAIHTGIMLKDEFFTPGMTLKVHLPYPSTMFQVSDVNMIKASHTPANIDDENSLARTVYFEEQLDHNEEFYVEYSYRNHVTYKDYMSMVDLVSPEQPAIDIEEQQPHIRFSPYLIALSKEIVGEETNPLKVAHLIYDYVTTKVKYSYMREYFLIEGIPQYCAANLRGDCGVQALLFITLCRINHIPARWQSGLYVVPGHFGPHDWAMFYVAPFGWLYADPSFGGSAYKDGDEKRRQFYFGNLDPFRMTANHMFQCEFNPPKKFRAIDPYDNQSGEIETIDGGFTKYEVNSNRHIIYVNKL